MILVLAATLVFQLYQDGRLNNIRQSIISLMMPTNTRLGPVETTTTVASESTPVFAADSETTDSESEAAASPFFAASSGSDSQAVATASAPVEDEDEDEYGTPASQTKAVAAPSAQPKEVDLSSLDRRYWPRLIKLNKDMEFSIVNNGKLVGQVAAPAGVMVKLLEIRGNQVVVAMATGSAPKPVDVSDTDLQERVSEIMKVAGPSARTSTAPARATSASTPFTPKLNERGRTPFQSR